MCVYGNLATDIAVAMIIIGFMDKHISLSSIEGHSLMLFKQARVMLLPTGDMGTRHIEAIHNLRL